MRVRVQIEISCGNCHKEEWVFAMLNLEEEVNCVPMNIANLDIQWPPGWKEDPVYWAPSRYCPDCSKEREEKNAKLNAGLKKRNETRR